MKRKFTIPAIALAAIACLPVANAKTVAHDSLVQNYMRSSLYTILLNSEEMNRFYAEEVEKASNGNNVFISAVKTLANSDALKATNEEFEGTPFQIIPKMFPTIEIPNQFNDHNLCWRVVNFDSIRNKVTNEELARFAPKKKNGLGKFATQFGKGLIGMSTTGNNNNDTFEKYAPAVINRFFTDNNVAPGLIAKWYGYDPDAAEHWNLNTVVERGHYNFNREDLAKASDDFSIRNKIDQTAFEMISNTYVMAINLRFRSYQAVMAEAQAAVDGVMRIVGGQNSDILSQAAGALASSAVGDGYTVQAVSYLYRLKWNDDYNQRFATEVYMKNASIEDLINAGICELEFVGKEKASRQIRQSLISSQPISSLVKRAAARAIDASIVKLQQKHEEFRTVVPIIGGDGESIYAAIGTKESLDEKDEYEILEANEDKKGMRTYKAIGKVKPVKGKIMDNAYDAESELDASDTTAEQSESAGRTYSEFKGKKGDFTGYYLRLKNKANINN